MGGRLKIGCIGASGRAGSLARRCARDPNAQLVAICDINPERIAYAKNTFKKSFGIELQTFGDYREMLKDATLDIVVVATPDWLHHEMAIAAFKAGKHVFLEKPVGINFKQTYDIVHTAKESGKILEIGYELRYAPFFREINQLLTSGELGRPLFADIAEFYHGGSHFFRDWHAYKKNVGGIIIQKCSHDFDLLYWMFGKPARVACFASMMEFHKGGWPSNAHYCRECSNHCPYYRNLSNPSDANQEFPPDLCLYNFDHDIEDNTHAIIQFESGLNAHLAMHFFPAVAQSDRHWRVNCSKAELTGRVAENWLRIDPRFDASGTKSRIIRWQDAGGGHGGGDDVQLSAFFQAIKEGHEAKAGLESAYWSSAMVMAAEEALEKNIVVEISQFTSGRPL